MEKTKFDVQIAEVEREGEAGGAAMTEAEFREEMAKDDARLHQGKKHAVHSAWVLLVRIMGIGAILLSLVVLWHLLAPESWRWLSPVETEHLTTGFFSALIGYMVRSVQRFI